MAAAKMPEDIAINPKDQEPIVRGEKQYSWKQSTYKPEYAKLAFNLLSRSTTAKNKSHLCAAFKCSRPTLTRWLKTHPEFNEAVVSGLEIGKSKWFTKLATHAFKPSVQVNNGLIKLLSAHVYGIKDDAEMNVVVNNTTNLDPEKLMKQRGIPVPAIDIEDIDGGNE